MARLVRTAAGGAAGLLLAGCGELVSLDAPSPEGTSGGSMQTGADAVTGPGSVGSMDASTGSDDDGDELPGPDLPVDPPAVCGPGCELELPRQWVWRGLDEPPGREPPPHVFSAITETGRDLFVAEQRGNQAWINSLDDDSGELRWSDRLSLVCDCQVIDLAPSPFGGVAFSAESIPDSSPIVVVGLLPPWSAAVEWWDYAFPYPIGERPVRVGSVLPLSAVFGAIGAAGVLFIQPDPTSSRPEQEDVKLHLSDGFNSFEVVVDTQRVTDGGTPPLGVSVGNDQLAVAFPAFTGEQEQGYAVWLDELSLYAADAQRLPGLPDGVAVAPGGGLLVLSHAVPEPGWVELQLGHRRADVPPQWEVVRRIQTDVVGPARLVMHPSGWVAVAVVVTREHDGQPQRSVEVLAFLPDDGRLLWRETVPLAAEQGLGLSALPDGGIVLATTIGDRVHVEKRRPTCACEEPTDDAPWW